MRINIQSSGLVALQASTDPGSEKNQDRYLYAALVIFPLAGRLLAGRGGNRAWLGGCGWLGTHTATVLEEEAKHPSGTHPSGTHPRQRNTAQPSLGSRRWDLLASSTELPCLPNRLPSWLSLLCLFQSFLGLSAWNADRKGGQALTKQMLIPFSALTQHAHLAANSSAFSLLRSSAARRISSSWSRCRAADNSCPCLRRCRSRSNASRSSLSSRSRCFWATSSNILCCKK